MAKTKYFWERRITGNIKAHAKRGVGPATDYYMPVGTPIHAPINGKITIGYDNENGNWIMIENSRWRIRISHLSKYAVTKGWRLWRTIIAYSGATGKVTGPHAHVVVWDKKNGMKRISFLGWLLRHAYKGNKNKLPAESKKFLGIK